MVCVTNYECDFIGHKTYLGFLYMEYTYNNPVANTFVALLTDQRKDFKGIFHSNVSIAQRHFFI